MLELTNIRKERDGKKRIYRAEFEVDSRKFNFEIEEWYLGRGSEYKVKIKEEGGSFFAKFSRPPGFPRMTQKEWYDYFFFWANKREGE